MSTKRGWGAKAYALLTIVLMLVSALSFGGGYMVGAVATPAGNWGGPLIVEQVMNATVTLRAAYINAGRVLFTDPGGAVTSAAGFLYNKVTGVFTAPNITTPGDLNATDVYADNLYADTLYCVGFTAGRIPIVGTGGLIGSDADLAFVGGDTLTVTKIGATSFTGAVDFTGQTASNLGAAGNDLGATNNLVKTTFSGNVSLLDGLSLGLGSVTLGVDAYVAWTQVAAKLGAEAYIFSLAVLDGSIYGGTNPNGMLYRYRTPHTLETNAYIANLSIGTTNTLGLNIGDYNLQQRGDMLQLTAANNSVSDPTLFANIGKNAQILTLSDAQANLTTTSDLLILTGDAGNNTITQIWGGKQGQTLVIFFRDNHVTITDTDAATAWTINLSAAWTSTANDALTLTFIGNKWYEISRSVN